MRHFIQWVFYLSLLSLFGMLSFHAHAQASPCHTTRNQWVVQVPYAIGYAPGTADWTPVSAPIQSTGADFYSCDGGNDAWRSIGFVEMDNPVGTVVGEDGASRHVYKTQIEGIGYALGFREQQYCGADAVRYIDGTSPVEPIKISMGKTGYVYVPQSCQAGEPCPPKPQYVPPPEPRD